MRHISLPRYVIDLSAGSTSTFESKHFASFCFVVLEHLLAAADAREHQRVPQLEPAVQARERLLLADRRGEVAALALCQRASVRRSANVLAGTRWYSPALTETRRHSLALAEVESQAVGQPPPSPVRTLFG